MKLFISSLFLSLFFFAANAQTASIDGFEGDEFDIEDIALLDNAGNQSVMVDLAQFTEVTSISVEDLSGTSVYDESFGDISTPSFYLLDLELFNAGYYTFVINHSAGQSFKDVVVK